MERHSVIGIDLGGTKIAAVRYALPTWEIEEQRLVETHASRGFGAVLGDILELATTLRTPATTGLGLGVPGLVAKADASIVRLPNIPGADGAKPGETLAKELELPCVLGNDAQCLTLAEAIAGAGEGEHTVVGITLGTGVGGGIVIDGRLLQGRHGFAGEIGHMLLRPGDPPEGSDDDRGDIEQFLSGTALRKRCPEAASPCDYLTGERCAHLHEDIVREVAWMCASIASFLDPSIVVFGGSVGRALEGHLPRIRAQLPRWMLPGSPHPKLALGALADAGTRGAAMLTQLQTTNYKLQT